MWLGSLWTVLALELTDVQNPAIKLWHDLSPDCQTQSMMQTGWDEGRSPERISKVNADAEVAAGLLHAVHTNPQLPSVAPTCCKCKNGKELQREKKKGKSNICYGNGTEIDLN